MAIDCSLHGTRELVKSLKERALCSRRLFYSILPLWRALFFSFFFFFFLFIHLQPSRYLQGPASLSLALCTRTPIKATSCSAIYTWLEKNLPSLFFVGGVCIYLSSFELHCSLNMTCKCTVFLLSSLCTPLSAPLFLFAQREKNTSEKERERLQTVTLLFLLFRQERRSSNRGARVCVCVCVSFEPNDSDRVSPANPTRPRSNWPAPRPCTAKLSGRALIHHKPNRVF